MRAVVQRVTWARVLVGDRVTGEIAEGLLVLAGVERDDGPADVKYISEKVYGLRVFEDEAGKMNRSLEETGGAVLVVSQFTLCGDSRKGRRPSFDAAEPPASAKPLYESLVSDLRLRG